MKFAEASGDLGLVSPASGRGGWVWQVAMARNNIVAQHIGRSTVFPPITVRADDRIPQNPYKS